MILAFIFHCLVWDHSSYCAMTISGLIYAFVFVCKAIFLKYFGLDFSSHLGKLNNYTTDNSKWKPMLSRRSTMQKGKTRICGLDCKKTTRTRGISEN